MLHSAIAAAHEQKGVMFVRNVAHHCRRVLDDFFQIRGDAAAVDLGWNIFGDDVVRHALYVELKALLLAEQRWAVVEYVKIGSGKSIWLAGKRIEPAGHGPILI